MERKISLLKIEDSVMSVNLSQTKVLNFPNSEASSDSEEEKRGLFSEPDIKEAFQREFLSIELWVGF